MMLKKLGHKEDTLKSNKLPLTLLASGLAAMSLWLKQIGLEVY